jgi:hypothetical protein
VAGWLLESGEKSVYLPVIPLQKQEDVHDPDVPGWALATTRYQPKNHHRRAEPDD